MSELVQRLSKEQPIEMSLRPEPTIAALKAALDRGYVYARFPNTRGGTELGIRLDPLASNLTGANLDEPNGNVKIVGELTFDYVRVRFEGVIDVSTFKGTGRLEILKESAGQFDTTA
jgi:hypothetical protein